MKKFFGVLLVAVCLSSCGYSTRSLLPANIRTIHIDKIKNRINYVSERSQSTYIPLLEVKVVTALGDRFMYDGRLRVDEKEEADLVLKGNLIAYEREALRYSDNQDVQEYRIRVTVALEMFNGQGEWVWSEPTFSGETTYFPSGPSAKTETAAIEEALKDLAQRVVERTVEDW